jgi:hypothetical protein
MTYTTPSKRLRALVKYGRKADVVLLARLGPSCALYVDSQPYQSSGDAGSPYCLTEADAFGFCCDSFQNTDKLFPLANVAAPYMQHLKRAFTTRVPDLMYLFMVAIETGLPGMADDVLFTWASTPQSAAEQEKTLGLSFFSSTLYPSYNIKAAAFGEKREECTVAEFLFGRSALLGHLCSSMLTKPFFSRNISVYSLDQSMREIAEQTKKISIDASYRIVEIKRRVIDPSIDDDMPVDVVISPAAREVIENVANRTAPQTLDWFEALGQEAKTVCDIVAATKGDIVVGVSHHRLRYVTQCGGTIAPPQQSHITPPAQDTRDPDDDIDDK